MISTTKQSMGIDPSFGATVLIEGKCFFDVVDSANKK